MKNNKNKIIVAVLVLLLAYGISLIDFRTTEDYYNQDNSTNQQLNSEDNLTSNSDLNGALQNQKENSSNSSDYSTGENIDPKKNKTNSSSSDDKNKSSSNDSSSDTIKVTIYIDVRNLNKKENYNILKPELRKYVPANGYVLTKKTIEVPKNSTSFDVLLKATRLYRIQMEYQGASENIYNSVYIQGINHLYEFSAGSESGWMYSVNGKFPNYGMSAYKVKNNDVIRMAYTCNLGCDLGYSMKSCD